MALLVDLLMALSHSVDLIDHDLGSHNKRVAYIAGQIAHNLGLGSSDITKTVIAASIHDIGALKETEFLELADFNYTGGIDHHSLMGYRLLASCPLTKDLADIVKHHHVSYVEKKYIQNSSIPIASDIIHLADRVDVLIDYKTDLLEQKNKVIEKLKKHSGTKLHPIVVNSFIDIAQRESFWFDLQFNSIEKMIKGSIYFNPVLSLNDIHEISKLFTKIIDFRSRYTATHSTSVAMVARELGVLLNLSNRECLMLDIAGHLHDVGKLAIPLTILEKPDTLTPEEWNVMKRHTYFTYHILDGIDNHIFKIINEWAYLHHEKLNGKGYPFKFHGDQITMGSRIMAVADMFTALAESRPYRKSMNDDDIINELKKAKGIELDPYIVDVLLQNYSHLSDIRQQSYVTALQGFEDCFDSIVK